MLLVDLGSILTVGFIALLALGWLYTFVKMKLIQFRIIDLPSDEPNAVIERVPNKYKEAFDRGLVSACETFPKAISFFIKCTAYALIAVTLLTAAFVAAVIILA